MSPWILVPLILSAATFATFAIREGNRTHRATIENEVDR